MTRMLYGLKQWLIAVTGLLLLVAVPSVVQAQEDILSGRTVVVDPGHGEHTGAYSHELNLWEDDVVLDIGQRLQRLLEQAGARVVMTRESSQLPEDPERPWAGQLEARMGIASNFNADLFLSIHSNAHPDTAVSGLQTYVASGEAGNPLPKALQKAAVSATGLPDKGIIERNFYVLRNAEAPAALMEIGFLSNPADARALSSGSFRQRAAEGLYQGIVDYLVASEEVDNAGEEVNAETPELWGYWAQWGTDPDPVETLSNHLGQLDAFVPYWYSLNPEATLTGRESNRKLRQRQVQNAGVPVYVLINNDKSAPEAVLRDPRLRDRAVNNIVRLVQEEGYDGVLIDFESLSPSMREPLNDFMDRLSGRLHDLDKKISMAVGAKTSSDPAHNRWAAAYDYTRLAELVDTVVLMTYDQHGKWSGPGPVAGLDWVKRVVGYAKTQMPAEKVVLGVAGYGYHWQGDKVTSLTAEEAGTLAARRGLAVEWSDRFQSPHMTYTAGGVQHEIWYENSWSAAFKLRLVKEEGLKGAALWSLGQEEERFWQVVDDVWGTRGKAPSGGEAPSPPSGIDFPDLGDHWARESVHTLVANGIVRGYPDGTFRPQQPVSRAEAVTMLTRLAQHQGMSVSGSGQATVKLDVSPGYWAYDQLIAAVEAGWIKGYPSAGSSSGLAGSERIILAPSQAMTRAEAAVIVDRFTSGGPVAVSDASPFSDMKGHWAQAVVARGYTEGWIHGVGGTSSFQPDRVITRGEAAALFSRQLQGASISTYTRR